MNLSAIAALPSFALLGPGWGGGAFRLMSPLEPGARAPKLLYRAYEANRSERYGGPVTVFGSLEVDVEPAVCDPSFDEAAYSAGVNTIRSTVAAGDVYQVNLTTRVALGSVLPEALVSRFCARGVPRFLCWIRAPGVEFVSASPELFFAREGRSIRVEPMKGTAPIGQRARLENSVKDDAELAMITDLMRNDLSRICEPRSVRVASERRFIDLPYALQAVSDVVGTLARGLDDEAVIDALHPAGSITGAPKEAAVAMIASLEGRPRGPYCGTLAWLEADRAVAAVLIRTASRLGDEFVYGVGGGITWGSVADDEVAEVRTKLGALR